MKKILKSIILILTVTMASCTVGWDEFKTEHIVSDFYLESMNNDLHTLVLKDDEDDNGGVIIVPSKVIQIGNNENFIAAVSCCDWTKPDKDTTYYIIDITAYNKVSWFQKLFKTQFDKAKINEFNEKTSFKLAIDTIVVGNKLEIRKLN